jgi:hypothetical protein
MSKGRWLSDLLEALPIPLKGVLLILIGGVALFCGWLDLKGGLGLMRVALLVLIGIASLALGVVILLFPFWVNR